MSHEVETMAYAHEVPWHGLGTNVKEHSTPAEMLKAAGLDWTIERKRLYTKAEDGTEILVPHKRAMVRSLDNKVMTITGQDWKPLQNSDLLNFFSDYSEAGGASLETAGSLRGGNVVWALANLHDGFTMKSGDRTNGYLLFTSPHKAGEAIKVRTTTVRVVCANTMAMAERSGAINYSQSHLKTFDMAKAKEAVEAAHENLAAAARRAETLSGLKMSVADQLRFLAPFCGIEEAQDMSDTALVAAADANKQLGLIAASVANGPGAEPDTAWGVLQGVTHWADHVNGRTAASRMFRSWVGDISKMKIDVEHSLMEMAA